MGAFFTTYLFTPANFAYPHNFAQVFTDSILSDTINWFHIKGSFVADSAYQYITLGNFFDDAHTDTLVLPGGLKIESGYFIDDVCVSTDSTLCFRPSTINELESSERINIFPNPASENFQVFTKLTSNKISIRDAMGDLLFEHSYSAATQLSFDCSSWQNGLYMLQINSSFYKVEIIH